MSYTGNAQNIAASDSNNAVSNDTSPKYTPQFSAATQMILERIQSRNSSSFSSIGITSSTPPLPGYEDMRRSVLQSMKTTLNMNLPSTPTTAKKSNAKTSRSTSVSGSRTTPTGTFASNSRGRPAARGRPKNGAKRRKLKDESEDSEDSDENMSKLGGDSDSDETEEITKFPKITQSGRQIVKPTQFVPATYENPPKRRNLTRKVQEQALCKRCGRGHSPENNLIVFCDGCNLPWHQRCHDPVISNIAVQDESSTWYCAECSRKKAIKSGYKLNLKGISWAGKSIEDKRTHLNSLSHSQLVSLLLQATNLYPDIPLFPAPTFTQTDSSGQTARSSYPSTAISTPGPIPRLEVNVSAPMNSVRKIQSSTPISPMQMTHTPSLPPVAESSNREESRESTPASPPYPRAGNGLMANIGPDAEDSEWLVESNDYEAFSHIVYDSGENMTDPSNNVGIGDVSMVNGGIGVEGMGIET
ncbi:hypothetical protein K3495_g8160 [Podosphaera aphanis]|nr:hypothetical protein K3495_g8160 [Podosphaera aphanis]